MELSQQQIRRFQEILWSYYAQHGRSALPWRQPASDGSFDPYKIMVSELMLQQTQVPRVVSKYHAFLTQFPNTKTLAQADLGDVLREWQGLGYNRRAKFLWQAAQIVDKLKYFHNTLDELVKLPGIGPNTAGAILAYAFNQPVVFIETNIRTVYIHQFLSGQTGIDDADIHLLIKQTLDHENPRQFYWALMDYGSHIKATVGNANRASKQYVKQSKFSGSRRQIRGQIIRLLGAQAQSVAQLKNHITDERLGAVLSELVSERLIREDHGVYSL